MFLLQVLQPTWDGSSYCIGGTWSFRERIPSGKGSTNNLLLSLSIIRGLYCQNICFLRGSFREVRLNHINSVTMKDCSLNVHYSSVYQYSSQKLISRFDVLRLERVWRLVFRCLSCLWHFPNIWSTYKCAIFRYWRGSQCSSPSHLSGYMPTSSLWVGHTNIVRRSPSSTAELTVPTSSQPCHGL